MSKDWTPCKTIKDLYSATSGNNFSGINRPEAGARRNEELARGEQPIQLYSLATPNGQKASILLEELLEAGCPADYDAHYIDILNEDQFSSGFVKINPNIKIPSAVHQNSDGLDVPLFESASICLYFAELFDQFIPKDAFQRAQMMNWIFWQMGSQGPMTGQFGHFFVYAPADKHEARDYGTARYGMEAQRLCHVLDQSLAGKTFLLGDEFSLADIVVFPWYQTLRVGYKHSSGIAAHDFLDIPQYKSAELWAERMLKRPGVQRGLQVCSWEQKEKGTKPWLVP